MEWRIHECRSLSNLSFGYVNGGAEVRNDDDDDEAEEAEEGRLSRDMCLYEYQISRRN